MLALESYTSAHEAESLFATCMQVLAPAGLVGGLWSYSVFALGSRLALVHLVVTPAGSLRLQSALRHRCCNRWGCC